LLEALVRRWQGCRIADSESQTKTRHASSDSTVVAQTASRGCVSVGIDNKHGVSDTERDGLRGSGVIGCMG
jgi:hypothetical protein